MRLTRGQRRTSLADKGDEVWKPLTIVPNLTLLEDVGNPIRVLQKWLVGFVDDAEPRGVDVEFMSIVLLLSSGLAEDLAQSLDDFNVDHFMLAAVDANLAWLGQERDVSQCILYGNCTLFGSMLDRHTRCGRCVGQHSAQNESSHWTHFHALT